jgi:hypothetical protein
MQLTKGGSCISLQEWQQHGSEGRCKCGEEFKLSAGPLGEDCQPSRAGLLNAEEAEACVRDAVAVLRRRDSVPQQQLMTLLSAVDQHCKGVGVACVSLQVIALESLLDTVKELMGDGGELRTKVEALERIVEARQLTV